MYVGSLPPQSNKADSDFPIFVVVDDDTDDPIDISTAAILFEVREIFDDCRRTILSASKDNGKIVLFDTGEFQPQFAASEFSCVRQGEYEVGCTIALNGAVKQFIVGRVPIVDGIVSTIIASAAVTSNDSDVIQETVLLRAQNVTSGWVAIDSGTYGFFAYGDWTGGATAQLQWSPNSGTTGINIDEAFLAGDNFVPVSLSAGSVRVLLANATSASLTAKLRAIPVEV